VFSLGTTRPWREKDFFLPGKESGIPQKTSSLRFLSAGLLDINLKPNRGSAYCEQAEG